MDQAVVNYDRAIQLDPQFVIIYMTRAVAYEINNDYDRAISDFTELLKINPSLASGQMRPQTLQANKCGWAYIKNKDYDHAINEPDQANGIDETDVDTHLARGVAYLGKGDYDRAIADAKAAIRFVPGPADDGTDNERALADFYHAVRFRPKLIQAYHLLGLLHTDKGNYNEAIADDDMALKIGLSLTIIQQGRKRLQELLAKPPKT